MDWNNMYLKKAGKRILTGVWMGILSLTLLTGLPMGTAGVVSAKDTEPYSVKAAASGDWEYTVLADGGVKIEHYRGTAKTVTVPGMIAGRRVTCIADVAFFESKAMTSVTIPDSVTSIGRRAFSYCSSLKSISVDSGSTAYAAKDGILYNKTFTKLICCPQMKTGEAVIPEHVTEIEEYAFFYSSVTGVMLPDSMTSIGDHAFLGCWAIEGMTIPDGVISIGNHAFSSCSSLRSITIPNSVTSIGEGAFSSCGFLTSVTIPNSVTAILDNTFWKCSSLTDVTIPSSVTSIGEGAFGGCTSLTDITIPDSVTSIGEGALESVSPSGITMHGAAGSATQQYAEKNGFVFTAHTPLIHPAIAPTCTAAGRTEGRHCSICGKVMKVSEKIPATGHVYMVTTIPATTNRNGSIIEKCKVCGKVKTQTKIYAASDIRLAKTSYTYNGKAKKPAVTVADSNGQTIDASNYKLTYPGKCKAVGTYTVTVVLSGNYSGTAKLTYTIKPKGTRISKLTAGKRGFTIKWKKQKKQTTGYQIQYSAKRSFKGAKTAAISKNKKTSAAFYKLKANRKYYVRIRTYKKVKVNGKSKKIYSSWSKLKTVKTKR